MNSSVDQINQTTTASVAPSNTSRLWMIVSSASRIAGKSVSSMLFSSGTSVPSPLFLVPAVLGAGAGRIIERTKVSHHHQEGVSMKTALFAATIITAGVAAGAASATSLQWTPSQMAAALTALAYPQPGRIICHGLANPRHGRFAAFKCQTGTVTLYAKPTKTGSVCASLTSLASCKLVAPLASLTGDPRICNGAPADCAESNAALAARRHAGGPGGLWQGPSFTCTLVGTLRFSCPLSTTVYTVTYSRGVTSWLVAVTP